ncbi:hypothetical protein TCA2_4451 [Paenibacillus sp. TCA20]|uniref:Single-stranded DNA-binding protein n=1 Tax=Paenibacillus urinalis TaxID=521520 RepID=A0ABY7XH94_9BACL|nr:MULTISPECIES: hypothetical protein [Paenibacillus]WDI05212.1 hypothetical protein PUW25_25730 [Paenibacillus urinalis]GAK41959.1 hypothetical protein TCA2_4451 [Paenibacillus sp. TCA20]
MSNYQNNGQGQQGNNNQGNSMPSHAEIELIVNLATVKDPNNQNGDRVHAYARAVGDSKVANASVAVNHQGQSEPDYWNLEVWANGDRDGNFKFLMEHCYKGRQLFIKGIPMLKKNTDGRMFPTIKVSKIQGLGSSNNNQSGNGSNQQQGGFGQQQQQGGGFQQQGYQQQPQQGFGQQQAGGFQQQQPQQGGFQQQPQQPQQGAPAWGNQQGFNQQQNGFGQQQPAGFGAPQQGGMPQNQPPQGNFQPPFGAPQR